jgi:subfamily B ATP-binding cassette protein MsbA
MQSERNSLTQVNKDNLSKKEQQENKTRLVKRYWSFIRPYRFLLLFILVLGMLQMINLGVPWMTKILIDEVLVGDTESSWTIGRVATVIGTIFGIGIIIQFIRNIALARLGNRMVYDIRRKLYEHLQKLSPNFYENRQIGGVLSRVINDVNGAQNLVGGGVINAFVDLLVVFFVAVTLFFLDWKLALLALWILPMYYLTFTNMNVRIKFAWRSVHRQMERISAVLVERLSGMKIVQSFNREEDELKRFDKQVDHHYQYSMSAHFIANLLGSFTQTFNHVGTLIIWVVGGIMVIRGDFTLGGLIAFQAYLGQMYGPIQRFAQVNVTIQNSLTNIERIFDVFDYKVDIQDNENAIQIRKCQGEIEFKNISFTYISEQYITTHHIKEGDPDLVERYVPDKKFYLLPPKTKTDLPPMIREENVALRHISFKAEAGQVIALVGASGAGKTTLVQLIPRFYDPDDGQILLDGVDLRDYHVMDVRRQIAMVMQDNILFSGTIVENIAYGRPEATMEEVIQAAKAANAHQFIMGLNKKYDTILGERGVRLSGGQKQRIAIARAILKDPKILILDEATSALDAESEELVTSALENLMRNRTTFIIAHRLATVVRANKILVLSDGKIVEEGSHYSLLKNNGMYRELYEKQLKAMKPEELERIRSII